MESIHELISFAKEMLSNVLAFFGVVTGLVETVCSPLSEIAQKKYIPSPSPPQPQPSLQLFCKLVHSLLKGLPSHTGMSRKVYSHAFPTS
uniref:Uncharacterized protein n=1 Tax=Dromaius novaehollandiae TaxID=8790 RepID=A0A8C4K8Q5_DRONO